MTRKKKFSDSELKKLYEQGLIDREIAEKLGVSKGAVWERRNSLGLPPNGRKKFSDSEFKELYEEGLNDYEIGEKLGVSRSAVRNRRNSLDLPPNGREYNSEWNKGKVIQKLKEISEDLGHSPTLKEVEDCYPAVKGAVLRYFDTWNEAKEKAGLETYTSTRKKREETEKRIHEILERYGPMRVQDLADLLDFGRKYTSRVVREMEDIKVFRTTLGGVSGAMGGRKYSPTDFYRPKYVNRRIVYKDEEKLADFLEKRAFKIDLNKDMEEGKKKALTQHLRGKLSNSVFEKIHKKYVR